MAKKNEGFSKEDLKLLKDIREERSKSAKSNLKEVSSSAKAQEQLTNLAKESLDLSGQLLAKEEEINNVVNARVKAQKDLSDYTEQYNVLIKGNADAFSEGNREIAKEILLGKQAALIATKKLDTLYDTLDTEKRATFEMLSALDVAQESLTLEKERLDVLEDMQDQIGKIAEKYEESLDFVQDINKFIDKMPGGALLSKVIGGDNLQKTITEKITKSIASASVAGEGLGKVMLGWGAALAGIMIVVQLVKWFDEMEGSAVTLAKELDISKKAAIELEHEAHAMAGEMQLVGVSTATVVKTMSELYKATGINYGELAKTNAAAKEIVQTSTILIDKFGMSGEEVSGLNDAAAITGQSMSDIAASAELMGDKLVSGVDIMKDVGKVSKSVLMNFNKNPEALVKAVKKAKMLGTTLDQINKSGEALLDIESSIEAEMTANVLTGKSMNLNKARDLALHGKTAELQDEIVKQMGTAAAYDDLGPIQKRAMAEALGMQADELNTMMMKQKQLESMGISQAELQQGLVGTAKQRAAIEEKVRKSKGDQGVVMLKAQIAEDDRMKTSEKFAASMTQFTDTLKSVLLPVIQGMGAAIKPVADFFANNGSWLVPLIGGFAAIAVSMKAFNMAKAAAGGIKDTISGIKGMLGKGGIADKLTPAVPGAEGEDAGLTPAVPGAEGEDAGLSQAKEGKNKASQLLDGIKNIIESIKGVVQSAISFVKDVGADLISTIKDLLMGVVDILKSVGSELISTIKDLLTGVVDILKLLKSVGSELISTIRDLLTGVVDILKSVGSELISTIRDLLTGVVDMLNSVGSKLLKVLKVLMDDFAEILYKATDIIVNVGSKLAEGAVNILDIIMKGLGTAANALPGIMTSLGTAVVAFFTPMALLVPLAPAIAIFTAAVIGLGYGFKLLGEGIGAAAPGIEAFFNGIGTVIEKVGQAIALVIETITTSIIRLQDINGANLLATAGGIVAVSVALAAFGAGGALAGIGGAIGSFFDEDPVDKFNRFAAIDANKLLTVAGAIMALGNAFKSFSSAISSMPDIENVADGLEDISSIDLPTVTVKPAAPSTATVKPAAAASTSAPAVNASNNSMSEIASLLKQLIAKVDQPVQFNIGGKAIDEISKQTSVRKSYSAKVDGAYGAMA